MSKSVEEILKDLANNQHNVRYADLKKVCDFYFTNRNTSGTSHNTYKTPWVGEPRINIQPNGKNAKAYQVKQVLKAVQRLKQSEQ